MNARHRTPATNPEPDLDGAFGQALRSRLDASVPDLPAGRGPAAAAARARARRRNRRAVLATAAAAAVVASATLLLPDDPSRTAVDTASGDVHVDPTLQLDWTVTDDGLSSANDHAAGATDLYALSTAPRTRSEDHPDGNVPRAMYRLAEDGTWTPVELEGDDPNLGTISERAGVLYALSTGTAARADGSPIGSMSVDGGATWSSVPLQVAEPPSDDVAWGLVYTLDIASTADHTLALVSARFQLPYDDLFPELADPAGPGYAITPTASGVDLAAVDGDGDVGDVVRSITWDEVGVSDPSRLQQHWAYVVEDGEWREVPAPDLPPTSGGGTTELHELGSELLLTSTVWEADGTATTSTLRSTDGRSWTPVAAPPGQLLPVGDDTLVHLGPRDPEGPGGFALQVSHDRGATWQPIDPAAIDPALAGAAEHGWAFAGSGPLGVALVVGEREGPATTMLFSTDARGWVVEDLAPVAPEGAWFGDILVGTDRLVVLGHTDNGEPGSPGRSATLTAVPRRT